MYVEESKRTESYVIEKNKCANKVLHGNCVERFCIDHRHIWYAVNEIQADGYGEIIYETPRYSEAVRWAKQKFGV